MRVLLSAFGCLPAIGSEGGQGWNWVCQIARFHEVWVLTWTDNQARIERALADQPLDNVHWIYFRGPMSSRLFWSRAWPIHYYLWHLGAWSLVRGLHQQVNFDVGHHVSMSTYWLPSVLALLPIPFIWGPLGGGESVPTQFFETLGRRGRLHEHLRDLARQAAHVEPFLRLTARRASAVLAMTVESAEKLQPLGTQPPEVCPGVALPADDLAHLNDMPIRNVLPFRVLSIGRLLHWKGYHLGIAAFAEFQRNFPQSEYWVVGDGPERRRLEKLAHSLNVSEKVRFWGTLPRDQAWARMAECDVLVHPSLRDSGGWVCPEAMAAHRPVICLDRGGPAAFVTPETGIKIPAHSPAQVVTDMAQAMNRLASDAGFRMSMADAAQQRARQHLCWDAVGEWIADAYPRVVGEAGRSRVAAYPS